MRRAIFFLFVPVLLFAQYWGERVTEKSFEHSTLYFNSFYLNPYGIHPFQKVALGLMPDPFLALHLNPAALPTDTTLLYIDFRGDRHEPAVVGYRPMNPYVDYAAYYRPSYDPRWYTVTRGEPEPVVSVGLLNRISDRFAVNFGYQFLFKEEPFYRMTFPIYYSSYGMNYRGEAIADQTDVPVIDRSAGEDNMLTRAHLWMINAGFKLNPRLAFGATLSGVIHNRSGEYARLNRSQYNTQDNDEWRNFYDKTRENDYSHLDFAAGFQYRFNQKLDLGVKIGYLRGTATQDYSVQDTSTYYRQEQNGNSTHSSYRNNRTNQHWRHKGHDTYGRISLNYQWTPKRQIAFYLRYSTKTIDLSSNSTIIDTSYYSGFRDDTYYYSEYLSHTRLEDVRHSDGQTEVNTWQTMFTFRTRQTKRSRVRFGVYFASRDYRTTVREPVTLFSHSYYHSVYQDKPSPVQEYTDRSKLIEDKTLVWKTATRHQTLQIPVMLSYDINSSWTILTLVNRMWDYWKVEDETTAYFKRRVQQNNDEYKEEENFGERYREPTRSITEENTDVLFGAKLKISDQFDINLLVNPDLGSEGFISQWWLNFRAKL